MNLSAGEMASVLSMWDKVSPQAGELGAEILNKFYLESPKAKPYFARFNLTPGSADLKTQGGKVMNALGCAANHLKDLPDNLSPLMDQGVDQGNIGPLSQSMKKVLTSHFPDDFPTDEELPFDKFIALLSRVLIAQHK